MPVIGASVAAAIIAPMPTIAYASGCSPPPGQTAASALPTAPPVATPMYNDGVNTPPDPPLPSVRDVVINLPTASAASAYHASCPNTLTRMARWPNPASLPPDNDT